MRARAAWERKQQAPPPKNKEVAEFSEEISDKPAKPVQEVFSFVPHQMAKVSVFFPMSRAEMTQERRRISKIEHETPWGKVIIEGIKLSIFEEDVFLALMALVGKDNELQRDSHGYLLETTLKKVVGRLYGGPGYTQASYERILRSLKNMQLVNFQLVTGEWKKRGKERLKVKTIRSIGNIVSSFKYVEESKDIKIWFNPSFFEYFLISMLTHVNLTARRKLKKDGSKALLRFISAHSKPKPMHIVTVLGAINFNTDQPMKKLREHFRGFVRELKAIGALGPRTRIRRDVVYWDLPKGKSLKLLKEDEASRL